MLCRMSELKADPFAMSAGRKPPTLDYGDLVPHVGVRRIVGDRVDSGLRLSPGLYSCAMTILRNKANLSTIWGTALNLSAFQSFRHEGFGNFECGSRPTT
jgi:hypothetical protein